MRSRAGQEAVPLHRRGGLGGQRPQRVRWRAGLPRYGLSSLVIAELVRDVPRGRPPSARGDVTKND